VESSLSVLCGCLALLVALGLIERLLRDRARLAVPLRIHVNGTRGKSTVTRLVFAALREAGIPAVAKVTGTTPRLLRPDGSEGAVPRRAPANIREQLWALRVARRHGACALVAECMAVGPELQWTSERDMIAATIGVITNVRPDHTEVMGRTVEELAASLANTIPRRAVLVTGDRRFLDLFERRARPLGTRVVLAEAREGDAGGGWLAEDRAIALAVTRELGIPDPVALAGMARALPDPGAVKQAGVTIAGRPVVCLDATAANDPESLQLLVEEYGPAGPGGGNLAAVYNHRADRPDRLTRFALGSRLFRDAGRLIITGDRPPLQTWWLLRKVRAGRPLSFVPRRRLRDALGTISAEGAEAAEELPQRPLGGRTPLVIFCGNTRGFDLAAVIGEAGAGKNPEFRIQNPEGDANHGITTSA
jgi:poly-gamma-glutamate synthase PgsB/CapB